MTDTIDMTAGIVRIIVRTVRIIVRAGTVIARTVRVGKMVIVRDVRTGTAHAAAVMVRTVNNLTQFRQA